MQAVVCYTDKMVIKYSKSVLKEGTFGHFNLSSMVHTDPIKLWRTRKHLLSSNLCQGAFAKIRDFFPNCNHFL